MTRKLNQKRLQAESSGFGPEPTQPAERLKSTARIPSPNLPPALSTYRHRSLIIFSEHIIDGIELLVNDYFQNCLLNIQLDEVLMLFWKKAGEVLCSKRRRNLHARRLRSI